MKVELCAVTSLDGFIARPNGGMDWASREDREWFISYAQDVGVIVIGRKTYEAALSRGLLPLKLRVVMTDNPGKFEPQPNTVFTDKTPQEILAMIEERKFDHVLIAGGSEAYGRFLDDNLVDEVHLTVEPVILGSGISLFAHSHKEHHFKLLETRNLNENTVQFHYQVSK